MNRQQIQDAFDPICPDQAAKEQMLRKILSQASDSQTAGKDVPMKKFKKRRPVLAAAMIALALLLVGCTAAVVLNLKDLQIDEYSYTQPAWINADGERIEETEVTKTVISLQGIAGSNNQMAAQEWYEFRQSYDTGREILNSSNDFQVPKDYQAYGVYSQEMIDKVDEIAAKYGLQLAGELGMVQDWTKDIFFEALGLDTLFAEGAQVEMGFGSGYFYECGNFKMEFECQVSDPTFQWEHPLWLSVNYKDKAYLDTVFVHLNVNATQRVYTLPDGTEVLLVQVEDSQNGDSVHVFYDREDAFLSMRIETNYFNNDGTVDTMDPADVELAINLLDFSVKPQKPNMAEVVQKLEAADKAYQAEMEARMAELGDPMRVDSYQQLIGMYEDGQFCLMDLNGDGLEECLLRDAYSIIDVFTMINGTTEPIANMEGQVYLCQDNVLEFYSEIGQAYYVYDYLKMEGNQMVHTDRLVYDRANEEWAHSNDGIRAEEVISQEEAQRIRDSYVRTELEMHPVSELQK